MAKTLKEIIEAAALNDAASEKLASISTKEDAAAALKELGADTASKEVADFLNSKFAEISEEDLGKVAGGTGSSSTPVKCPKCGSVNIVKVASSKLCGQTWQCKETSCKYKWVIWG